MPISLTEASQSSPGARCKTVVPLVEENVDPDQRKFDHITAASSARGQFVLDRK